MRVAGLSCLLLLLLSPMLFAQQRLGEGACILLLQQIERFSQQKRSSNYRNAKREYDLYCQPVTQPAKPQVAKPAVKTTVQIEPVPESAPQAAAPKVTTQAETPAQTATDLDAGLQTTAEQELTRVSAMPPQVKAEATTVAADTVAAENLGDANQKAEATPQIGDVGQAVSTPAPIVAPDITNPPVARQSTEMLLMRILTSIPLIAANLVALLLLVFLITSWFGLNLPGFKGVFAEYKLNRLLRWRLPAQYQHFRKLKLLTSKDEPVVVDHLVLSPFGIFVILVKSDRGRIWGSETQANWVRQYFGRKSQLMNPLHQNFKNTEAVRNLLQLSAYDATEQLHSVVAFNRVASFASAMPANVCYVDGVAAFIKSFTQPCLTDEQLQRFAAVLKQASTG
ncbi:MAG: NERD domain-containing protein [Chromatiaceae bacterium]|nr:NERD domain-containing protein [Chromatiaceae bacterium]